MPSLEVFPRKVSLKITRITPWLISARLPYLDTANDNAEPQAKEYVFVEVNTDGRDPDAIIVHIKANHGKNADADVLVRATRNGGAWNLKL